MPFAYVLELRGMEALNVELPIAGCWVRRLVPHGDSRGVLRELFRVDWRLSPTPQQWNLVHSAPNAMRGAHIHRDHDDYLVVVAGTMVLGLHDLRADSRTFGVSTMVHLDAADMKAVFVPRGVIHAFCFVNEATYIYGLTSLWSLDDDLGCSWNDPGLGFDWPLTHPQLSERDAKAQSLADLKAQIAAREGAR
jgi:dTDP-4-dehydrorhamnose 3,5-epimerase